MDAKRVIYYYGRGYVESSAGRYVKQSDYDYWSGCLRYYNNVNLVLYVNSYLHSSNEYSAPLKKFGGDYSCHKIDTVRSKLSALKQIFWIMIRSPRKSVHFFYYPNSFNVVLFVFAKILGKRTVSYWGNEWGRVGELVSIQAGRSGWLKFFYHSAQKNIVRLSDLSIFAGKSLFKKFSGLSKRSLETKPFISIDKNNIYVRDDTCKGKVVSVLYVGTFTERKGVLDLLRVSELVEHFGRPVEFVLVGAGKLQEIVENEIQSRGLESRVRLAGYVGNKEKLLNYFRKADIFFLPSYMEGFPRVLYESMSQSLPILCTDVGSIPILFEDEVNALICSPGDVDDMVKKLNLMISDSQLRQKMIGTNRRLFEEIVCEKPADQHSTTIEEMFYEK